MQINYPNEHVRRSTVGFWYAPDLENSLQAMDVPSIYAPYGTYEYWPNAVAQAYQGSQNGVLNIPDNSIAPNSGGGTNVTSAAIAAGFSGASGAPPAESVGTAASNGAPLSPVTLVAPLPSITQTPTAPTPAITLQQCSTVNSWINQNPMIAAVGILAAYLFLGGMK